MKPYKPSNKVTNAGFTWLTVTALIGGLAIGGVTALVSRLFYLIVLFPLLMGAGGGFLQAYAVNRGKVRNPMIAGAFAILTGFVIYGTLSIGYYVAFRQEVAKELKQSTGESDDTKINKIIDENVLQIKTGSTGFLGFLKFSAQQGVGITRGSSKIELKNEWAWGYWAIELAVISGITAFMAFAAAKEPFCENSDEWYLPMESVGSVPNEESENFLSLIKNENFVKAGALVDPQKQSPVPNLLVHLQRSPGDRLNDLVLIASRTSLDNKGNVSSKEVIKGMISPSQYAQFEQAVNANLQQSLDVSETVSEVNDNLG
ncbi:MAG: hypothetical protein HC770_06250 [Pseudanabaena sp. CRU_2_10]|nr:hypothetical protein [Pseudanabaena sp. CRU_2_10]